ncbi:MAG: phosphotransferase, partial [bacterium]
ADRLHGRDAAGPAVETLRYARWGAPDRIAALAEPWLGERAEANPLGAGVRTLPVLDAVLVLLPNDRNLRLLPKVASLDRLKRLLAPLAPFEPAGFRIRERKSALELRRYKPEQRLVALADLALARDTDGATRTQRVVVRLFADPRGGALQHDLAAWRAAGAAARLPEPFGSLEDGHIYVEGAVPGDTLRARIRAGLADPGVFARALVELHAARPALGATRTVESRLALVHAIVATLVRAQVPGVQGRAELASAARPETRTDVPVHGDLHARQVLVGDDGEPVFVDFERAAMGDPLDDLGNLIAHLVWEHDTAGAEGAAARPFAEAVTREYALRAGSLDARSLAFHEGCAFLEIAELPVRRRLPEAAATSARAVARARAAFARAL